jgi:ornithine cyclodeaminase/alanine dehydrogenase-like protein (mu-crystallin family)
MVLILSESDVVGLLNMTDGVSLVEQAFSDFARGEIIHPPRISQNLPGTGGALRVVSAVLPSMSSFGIKTLTGYPGRRTPGETYFVLLLFEMETGALRAIVSANYLTGVRTGAATGVAVKYLAREDARIHGVLGAGMQAKYQIQAVASVRPIKLVKIFAPNYQKASAFADSLQTEFGINTQAVQQAKEAVRGCDIVTAITTSREPVVLGKWLDDGVHLTSAGANSTVKMELDSTCYSRSKVVTDSKALAMEDGGDLRAAIESSDITAEHLYAELGEVVNGDKLGRTSADELTLFKSIGLGFQDIAVAAFLYERALKTRTGAMIDLEGTALATAVAPFSMK